MLALAITWLSVPASAMAGVGATVTGTVWADTNRDQVHQAAEVAQAGVTVNLLLQPGGAVAATTTTNSAGKYTFSNVPDGTYIAQVIAPSLFAFPPTASGDNKFSSGGAPAPGQPQTGVSAGFVIAGATQVTGLDAGMQPIATIDVQPLTQANACQNLAVTGTPPFDATDGAGMDSGTSNCLVRTNDNTTQLYGISVTGLPTGAQVNNVIVDFTISSTDGAAVGFTGIATGCLSSGVSPASSIVTNPDGSQTMHCNLGTFSSAGVSPVLVTGRAGPASGDGTHFTITASARAANGDAIPSSTVTGPAIQVTGTAKWDLSKGNWTTSGTPSTMTINGVPTAGYAINYIVVNGATNASGKGVLALADPYSFTEKINLPSSALFLSCTPTQNQDGSGLGTTPGTITGCPAANTPVNPNGFTVTVSGLDPSRTSNGWKFFWFLPLEGAYRMIDPTWQPGQPVPTGTIPVTNQLTNTNGWHDRVGNLNNGTGFEPGWDGTTATGNNVATVTLQVKPPAPGIPGSGKTFGTTALPGVAMGSNVSLKTDFQTTVTNPYLVDVFDVSVLKLNSLPTAPPGYVIEYAQGPNSSNLKNGAPINGKYPYDTTALKNAVTTANTTFPGPWVTDPTTFGPNWQDTVNMVRMRPIDPATFLTTSATLTLSLSLMPRSVFNGGPYAGQQIPAGVQFPNEGGWTDPTVASRWSTQELVANYVPLQLNVFKTPAQPQYLAGDLTTWTLRPGVVAGLLGTVIHQLVVTDVLNANLQYDAACTNSALPSGVSVSYNPVTRTVTYNLGDFTVGSGGLPVLTLCATVSSLTPAGTTIPNTVTVTTPDAPSTSAGASVFINGTGRLALDKSVDHPLTAPGQPITWTLKWSNTTSALDFQATDLIDVLPWNGDAAAGSLSKRDQYASAFSGTTGLPGPLAQPVYTAGESGAVPGTWYYAVAAPSTINQDPRDPSNSNPGAAGSVWQSAAQISAGPGFGKVTAIRFVSTNPLLHGDLVSAAIPYAAAPAIVNGRSQLDDVYVNRAMIFSPTFPNQPLPSNEVYALVPGWTIGDVVWVDTNANGIHDAGDVVRAGVPIEVRDHNGVVVATATTNASGRWVVAGLPAGSYTVHIPASAFQPGGPLAGLQTLSLGSSPDPAVGESLGNKNDPAGAPDLAGLSSLPVEFAYVLAPDGSIQGGNQPPTAASDPGGLVNPMLPAGFMNMNMDLAATPIPTVALVKSANTAGISRVGQVVTYSFAVTNTGGVPLSAVGVVDTQSAPAGGLDAPPACPPGILQPGETVTCVADYTVTQADLDNGMVNDSAVATATPGGMPPVSSPPSDVSIPSTAAPAIRVVKSADTTTITGPGQLVTYSFLVTNTGALTLDNVTVTDLQLAPAGPLTRPVVCPAGPLAPGSSATCSATYTVTQADLDNGTLNDQATASANPPDGSTVSSDPSYVSIPSPNGPSIDIVKTASESSVSTVGQVVHYSFLVTNTGMQTVHTIHVTDTQYAPAGPLDRAVTCPQQTLAPGAQTTCTSTYTVTQADLDNGTVDDAAFASGLSPNDTLVNSSPSDVSIPTITTPGLSLLKSASESAISAAGQVIHYSFTVTNTGTVTVQNLAVTDTQASPAGPVDTFPACPVSTLMPAQTVTCTASYTVTQADIENGSVSDSAVANGFTPANDPVASPPDGLSVPTASTPGLTLLKTAAEDTVSALGDTIHYSFLVTNTGNRIVQNIVVTDVQAFPAGPLDAAPDCPVTTLAPGESTVCTATYTVTQADLEQGVVDDTAHADGATLDGTPVVTGDSTASVPATPRAGISIVKSGQVGTDDVIHAVGDTIHYSFLVANTGTVTLHNIRVTDVQTFPAGALDGPITCPTTDLAVGESTICTAGYTVTQADIDNGSVNDSAVATGDAPGAVVSSTPSSASLPDAPQTPELSLVKTAAETVATHAGEVIHYTFRVTNTGTLTLNTLTVADSQTAPAGPLDAAPVCPSGALAPGDSVDCTATYTLTQADIDNGSISDSAVANARTPDDSPVASPPSDVSIHATAAASMTLEKAATEASISDAGDVIHYTFLVTNTGGITLHNLTVTDTQAAPAGPLDGPVVCPVQILPPGDSTTCTGAYTTTASDIAQGVVDDTAVADAITPDGSPVGAPPQTASVPVAFRAALSLVKTASEHSFAAVGEVIHYTFVVTNTGNDAISQIVVSDTQSNPSGELDAPPVCDASSLAAGASTECHATYTVTQADVDNGVVDDSAIASGTAANTGPVESPASEASVPGTGQVARLFVEKTSDAAEATNVGEKMTMFFAVTNTGTVTAHDIAVVDTPIAPASPLDAPPVCPERQLAPDASMTCTGTYTVTAADLANGSIGDTATATATDPSGAAMTSNTAILSMPAVATLPPSTLPGTPPGPSESGPAVSTGGSTLPPSESTDLVGMLAGLTVLLGLGSALHRIRRWTIARPSRPPARR